MSSAAHVEGAPAPLSFADFLEKMKDPAAADLVRNIKGFIRHFDERSSKHIPNLGTDSAAVQDFFVRMESMFRTHPAWNGAGPDVIDQAVEGLEKYVMSKIWPRTFAASSEDRDRDGRYSRLAQALSFVDLTTLMGVAVVPDDTLVATAVEELVKMDRYKAPRDKLLCLVNVKTLVEDIVGEAVRRGASIGGADAFFPVFLLVVVHAKLPRLASNIDYIRRFRARSRLTGQFDYMLCNLESAAMYFDTADWQHLGVTREYFLKRLADAGIPEAAMELRALEDAVQQENIMENVEEQQSVLSEETTTVDEREGDAVLATASASVSEHDGAAEVAAAEIAKEEEKERGLQQPLLSIEVPETLGGEAGTDLQNIIAQINYAPSTTTTATGDGLTPLGAGPQTPILMKQRATTPQTKQQHEQPNESELSNTNRTPIPNSTTRQNEGRVPTLTEQHPESGSGAQVVAAMVADGTPLVLEEEAEGRLQQRHPWIYAAAEDLNIADVRSLLAEYRDLVLKYEAVTLSLQQQVSNTQGRTSSCGTRNDYSNTNQGLRTANVTNTGNFLLGTAQSSGGLTESAGALIQKLASWGASRTPSGRQLVDAGSSSEAAAALQGKAAAAGARGASPGNAPTVDARLLQSLFGSPSGQQTTTAAQRKDADVTYHSARQQRQQPLPASEVDLLGDLETEVKIEGGGGGGRENILGSPALGLIEGTQAPTAEIPESLI